MPPSNPSRLTKEEKSEMTDLTQRGYGGSVGAAFDRVWQAALKRMKPMDGTEDVKQALALAVLRLFDQGERSRMARRDRLARMVRHR